MKEAEDSASEAGAESVGAAAAEAVDLDRFTGRVLCYVKRSAP